MSSFETPNQTSTRPPEEHVTVAIDGLEAREERMHPQSLRRLKHRNGSEQITMKEGIFSQDELASMASTSLAVDILGKEQEIEDLILQGDSQARELGAPKGIKHRFTKRIDDHLLGQPASRAGKISAFVTAEIPRTKRVNELRQEIEGMQQAVTLLGELPVDEDEHVQDLLRAAKEGAEDHSDQDDSSVLVAGIAYDAVLSLNTRIMTGVTSPRALESKIDLDNEKLPNDPGSISAVARTVRANLLVDEHNEGVSRLEAAAKENEDKKARLQLAVAEHNARG